jgi:hypothetical protein
MKSPVLIRFLATSAVLLVAANAYVYWPSTSARIDNSSSPQPVAGKGDTAEPGRTQKPRSAAPSLTTRPALLKWAPVESSDYKEYIANLRKLGFPEELIREIIIADINKLYAPREAALKPEPVPQDAPLSRRRRKPEAEDIQRMTELRDIQIEKHRVLQELLGVRVPREMIRTPNSRNWEGYEYAISLLPSEKQEAVQLIQENLWIKDDWNQTQGPDYLAGDKTELDAYRLASEERDAALKQILTPEEFEKYERNSTPTGTELARRVVGMDPTEEEMTVMYKLTDEYWQKTGAVHGRWRANAVPSEQIASADEQLKTGLQQALGPERYVDYQMATSNTGQQMNSLSIRYDLPRETIREAFSMQTELDQLAKRIPQGASPDNSGLQIRQTELEQKLQQTLGPDIWQAWINGRNQRYNLQP